MSVTHDHLDKLAKLAALQLTDEQKARFAPQLNSIVWLVSKLESLDLDIIESVSHIQWHTNEWVRDTDFDFLGNVRHPIAGQMPWVSFTTRSDG